MVINFEMLRMESLKIFWKASFARMVNICSKPLIGMFSKQGCPSAPVEKTSDFLVWITVLLLMSFVITPSAV